MTTKDEVRSTVEALNLALEALEDYVEEYGPHEQDSGVAYAITAIRAALASKSEALMSVPDGAQSRSDEDQPAQQQEPVAMMTVLHLKDRTEIGYGPALAGYDLPTGEYKLYTSPPASKTWVSLTDDEVKHQWEIWRASIPRYVGFAKGIEAKLKEKNGF